ncbi:MAG: ABC transporter ATP-binding protein [Wenzhouxiangellaceae bacterium]
MSAADGNTARDPDAARASWRFGLALVRPHRVALILIALVALLDTVASLLLPLVAGSLTEHLLAAERGALARLVAIAAILLLLQHAARIGSRLGIARIGDEILLELRRRCFEHMQRLPMSVLEQRKRGDLLSLLTTDAQTLAGFFSGALPSALPLALTLAGGLALIAWLHPALAGIIVVTVGLAVVAMKFWMRAIHRRARTWFDAQSATVDLAEQALELAPVIRAAAREDRQMALYQDSAVTALKEARRLRRIYAPLEPTIQLAATLGVMGVVLLAAGPTASRPITPGELVTLLLYAAVIARPLAGLAELAAQWFRTRGALARLLELLHTPTETDSGRRRPPRRLLRGIHFEQLRFGYDPARPVLDAFDLHIPAGSRLALTGPNGAGKSTLIYLLLRFYQPQAGRITLDGTPIDQFDLRALRRAIALVPQRTWLFQGTIADNIRLDWPDADLAQIRDAAHRALADEFIEQLPDGYQTLLGARGSGLSGGQQQRLALARALLSPTPILVLDEATSMFDEVGEARMIERLEPALAGRTVIMITHRPRLLELADRIVPVAGPAFRCADPRRAGAASC